MSHYSMVDENIVSCNLEFKLRYPLYKTITAALDRFHDLHKVVESIPKDASNRDLMFKYLNECDFILNTLEGYDL